MQRNYLAELQNGQITFLDIPPESRTEDIWLAAVQKDGSVLSRVPEEMRTETICLAAVQQNGLALSYIPKDKQTKTICLAAVQQNGSALDYVPENMHTEALFLAAVQRNGLALHYVPIDKRTEALFLAAVQQNGLALQYVSTDKRTEEICLAAVHASGLALMYVPEVMRTETIRLAAVQQNGLALKFILSEHRAGIIDSLSAQYILSNNYAAINYFPPHSQKINDFLHDVEYVLINASSTDHELKDIQLTYAHNKNRKTVAIMDSMNTSDDLKRLLDDLKSANNNHSIHLVLIDHSNLRTDVVTKMHFYTIADICQQYPAITHIQLLSCNVAKANKSQAEKNMIQKFSEKILAKKALSYGFATTRNASLNDNEFQKKCMTFCKKHKLDGVYMASKDTEKSSYRLLSIKYFNDYDSTTEKSTIIPEGKISHMSHLLENQKKSLSFPTAQGELRVFRGDNNKPLTIKELNAIRALRYAEERFDKTHPKYKKDKKTYPFLAKMQVEIADLQPSFLKRLVDAIQNHSEITQSITIQGVTKSLHVDTAKNDFKVTETYLYNSDYKQSFFDSKKVNLHYDKLNKEQQDEIKEMEKNQQQGLSMAKQLKVVIPKK